MAPQVTVLQTTGPEAAVAPVAPAAPVPAEELATDELLVEEVSIDGMCGVY